MITVCLLRHAKSSWDDPGLQDYDRPLAPRGDDAARRMGEFMAASGLAPETVLCSGARRAVETWERVAPWIGNPQPEFDDTLYMAPDYRIIGRLRALPGDIQSVLLIGHNPGIEDAAIRLCGTGKEKSLDRMRKKYPTGALAMITFESVEAIGEGAGCLEAFVRPKDL